MKNYLSKLKLLISLALMSATDAVFAAMPTADALNNTVDIAETTDPIAIINGLLKSGVGTASLAVVALVTLGGGWAAYSSFIEARKKGEWKDFGITTSIAVVLIIGVGLMAILAKDYVTN